MLSLLRCRFVQELKRSTARERASNAVSQAIGQGIVRNSIEDTKDIIPIVTVTEATALPAAARVEVITAKVVTATRAEIEVKAEV